MDTYQELNAGEFWERLKTSDLVSGIKCLEDVLPIWGHINFKTKQLTKCQFKKLVLSNINFDDLTIHDCSIDSLEIKKGCRFEKPLFIKKSKIGTVTIGAFHAKVIVIDEQSQIDTFTSDGTDCPRIIINDCKLTSLTIVSRISLKLDLSSCSIAKEMVLDGTMTELTAHQIQCENVTLKNFRRVNRFIESKCSLIKWESSRSENLIFNDCQIEKFEFIDSQLNEIQLNGGNYEELHFEKSSIQNLRNISPVQETVVKSLVMDDHIFAIDLYYLKIDDLQLRRKNLNGGFQLTNAKISNSFTITDSRLKDAKFNNIDLYGARMEFVDSSITSSQFVNIRWPKGHLLVEPKKVSDVQEELKALYSLRESYRQLKVVCNREMNYFEELIFKKHELRVYWKIINIRTWAISWSSALENIDDWLVLWTNKVFSNFGMSVFKPLGWLVLINFLLFNRIIYLYDFGITPSVENHNWNAFWHGIGLFVNLLNPVHPFVIENVNILGFTDITMRVVSGYLLYYFLKASRKFSG